MDVDDQRPSFPARFWIPALAIALGLVACSSDALSSADGATTAMCGAGTPTGQACSNAPDNSPTIQPTCATGTMPVGTGGTVVAGTYHFTSQTYYNVTVCPTTAFSGTLVVGGGCIQTSTDTPIVATTSSTLVIQGNTAVVTLQCVNTGSLSGNPDAPNKTFTATPTTLTFFTMNAQAGNFNPDRVEVFTR